MSMTKKLLLLCVLVGIGAFTGRPHAQTPVAAFHSIGDLPGGDPTFTTLVKDATRVGDTIYAVGSLNTKSPNCTAPCFRTDTPFLWQFNGTTATLTALPDLTAPNGSASNIWASAITPDGAYIASQARLFVPNVPPPGGVLQTRAVRVTAAQLTNLDLGAFAPTNITAQLPVSISSAGDIVYGVSGIRLDTNTSTKLLIPRVCVSLSLPNCPVADTNIIMAPRGVSADGSVAVGSSAAGTAANRLNVKAFRYVHDPITNSGVCTAIPCLPGGTFNDALAVSPDGSLVLVTGNSTDYPNGEAYLYDFSKPVGSRITRLGSANAPWRPGGRLCTNTGGCQPGLLSVGGMTADGSVVAMSFQGNDGQYGYFRNVHGWFHLTSALGAQGIDIAADGWNLETLQVQGMSPDGTLVWGSGSHRRSNAPVNGAGDPLSDTEGFVAVFPAGFLASFNPQPTPPPPAYSGLIGVWTFVNPDEPGGPSVPDAPGHMVIFTGEGVFYHLEGDAGEPLAGFERNLYKFTGSQVAFTTLFDSNGSTGLSSDNGTSFGPVAVVGDELLVGGDVQARRIVGGPGSIIGGWIGGNPAQPHNGFVLSFAATGYSLVYDLPDGTDSEVGTYTWDPVTHELVVTHGGEVNGENFLTLSADERELLVVDPGESFTLTRVVDPRTPTITSALEVTATTGLPFAYQIAGTNGPTSFGLAGTLPAGLGFNTATGVIAGTPTQAGTFEVRVEALNALSTSSGVNRLSISVIQPVAVALGPTTVTPIPPEAGEPPPVTIEFTNVTSTGTVSVATVDPEAAAAPDPPAGFSLGDDPVYYEITPSPDLRFDGPIEVCFSYAGVTFAGVPRLLHYEVALASWVDITTSVDVVTTTVCGLTSSFSPFAIAASALKADGFHQPIEPVAGAVNTAKGGSTVPLKFNVFNEAGVEITNPSHIENLDFLVSRITCDTGAHEDAIPFETTGATSVRYDATGRQFVQNWQTPKTPRVCYLVKVTGDGLLLSARFKLR